MNQSAKSDSSYAAAVTTLKTVYQLAVSGDPGVLEIKTILGARDEVCRRTP